ncbi:DUF397 domain-containing protein [Actinomadura sp. 7K534]|nr:DUF397 domain-containing protein [Actinomadura sp. 7K534]
MPKSRVEYGSSPWRRSTTCKKEPDCTGETNCVEVANFYGIIAIRDSKKPDTVLYVPRRFFGKAIKPFIPR